MDFDLVLSHSAAVGIGVVIMGVAKAFWGRYEKSSDGTLAAKDQTIAVLMADKLRLEDERNRLGAKYDALFEQMNVERLRMAGAVIRSRNSPNLPNDFEEEIPTIVRRMVSAVSNRPPAPTVERRRGTDDRSGRFAPAVEEPYRPKQRSRHDDER